MLNWVTFAGLIICAAAFYALGRRILGWCNLVQREPMMDWVFSSTAGLIVISNLVMIAGFAHLLYQPVFWVIILGSILPNLGLLTKFIRTIFSKGSYKGWNEFLTWEKMLIGLILLYLVIRLINTFSPVFTWDATTHHYLVPSMYLKKGYIYNLRDVIFSYYPSLIEMLYMLGMSLTGSDLLSSHIGWLFGPLTAAGVYLFGAKFLSRRTGLLSTVIFLSLGGIGVQMEGGYVDLPQALFCLLCLYKLLDWRYSRALRDFILAALFFSASLATKHLGYAALIPMLIYIGYILLREWKSGIGSTAKYTVGFLLLILILPLPWYIRSYIYTGNPFYPFPVFGFPTLRYPPLEITTWVNPGFKKNILSLITYLWFLTTNIDLDGALGKRFTPYFLAMLPFFWIAFRRGTNVSRVLFWMSLFFMGFVFVSAPVKTRYMLFFLPFMSILAADILDVLFLKSPDIKNSVSIYMVPVFLLSLLFYGFGIYISYGPITTIMGFLLYPVLPVILVILIGYDILKNVKTIRATAKYTVTLAVIFMITIPLFTRITETSQYIKDHTIKVIIGTWDASRYLYRESPRNYGAIDWMNHNLPKDSKILAIETRMYGLQRNWITWLGLDNEPIPTTPEDNVRLWRKYGFTHLWIGDDATTKTLIYYNIYNLPGDGDNVVFTLQDLWTNFFGKPFSNSIISSHLRSGWMPRELRNAGYEWYENGKRVTDADGRPLYKASRKEIESDPRKMAQINFVKSIRELVRTGGLHIVYPPPGGKIKEELTFIMSTDYESYKASHPDVDL